MESPGKTDDRDQACAGAYSAVHEDDMVREEETAFPPSVRKAVASYEGPTLVPRDESEEGDFWCD